MINIDEFIPALEKVRKSGNGYRACCPAHNGDDANLVLWTGLDGTIQTKCYSHGCDRKEIVEAAGFTLFDILPARTPQEIKASKVIANDKAIKKALVVELLILLQWLDAFYRDLFPEQQCDIERVKLAWERVVKAGKHYQEAE